LEFPPGGAAGPVVGHLLFGLFALIYGISQVSAGIQLRQTGGTVRSVLRNAA
jgi:hypothetical protein